MGGTQDRIARFVDAALNPRSDSDGQLLVLFSLVVASGAKVIVETGVWRGDSTLPLLAAASLSGGEVWSVDINDTPFIPPDDLRHRWHYTKQDALLFLGAWPKDRKIDVAFLDDWHSYQHVKRELELLDPLIGPSSLVLLHDTMRSHSEPFYQVDLSVREGQWADGGPARAMMELDPMRWEWATLPWWHGLSIIRKKHSKIYFSR